MRRQLAAMNAALPPAAPMPKSAVPQPTAAPLQQPAEGFVNIRLSTSAAAAIGRPSFLIRGLPDLTIMRQVQQCGSWEPHILDFVAERLPVGGTFIDVGANIGVHAVMAALKAGPEGRVLAIEASPITFQAVAQNLKSLGYPGATAVRCGVWDSPATMTIHHITDNHAHSHLGTPSPRRSEMFSVDCKPLDQLIVENELSRVDMIKIDVEGSEIKVLEGAAHTLAQYRPPIVLEINPGTLRQNQGTTEQALYDCVRSHGYNVRLLSGNHGLEPIPNVATLERILGRHGGIDVLCEHTG